jgi:hypothetical protein
MEFLIDQKGDLIRIPRRKAALSVTELTNQRHGPSYRYFGVAT